MWGAISYITTTIGHLDVITPHKQNGAILACAEGIAKLGALA